MMTDTTPTDRETAGMPERLEAWPFEGWNRRQNPDGSETVVPHVGGQWSSGRYVNGVGASMPLTTEYVRADLYDATVARAEAAKNLMFKAHDDHCECQQALAKERDRAEAAEAKIRQAQEFCRSVVEEDDDDPEALVGYVRGAHFACRKMLAVLSGQEEDTE